MDKEQKLSTEPYKGVRDFYPEDWAQHGAIFRKIRRVLRMNGYAEYQASPLERTELYESKGNDEIVSDQTYTFEDRGGRSVTLRPEMTPTLARMVAAKRRELTFPLRWFSIGNRFRYERPQKGRLREFYQADIDLVGLPEGEADREIVWLAYRIVKAFGAKDEDFKIRVNDRRLLMSAAEAAGCVTPDIARQYLRLLDKKDKLPAETYRAQLAAIVPRDPMAVVEEETEGPVAERRDAVKAFIESVKKWGVSNIVFDPTLARGFDYYTGIVFEIFDTNPENPRALFGGGRYDGLVSLFGGEAVPAVGFAFGDVTFQDFLATHNLLPAPNAAPDIYIGTASEELVPAAQMAGMNLRMQRVKTWVNLRKRKLFDQIDEARKRGIPFFTLIGDEEAGSGMLRLQPLRDELGRKDDERWKKAYSVEDAAHVMREALKATEA